MTLGRCPLRLFCSRETPESITWQYGKMRERLMSSRQSRCSFAGLVKHTLTKRNVIWR